MTKELIISSSNDCLKIALLSDGSLLEYHVDDQKQNYSVGDIYLGIVKSISSGMNAAFVDIGSERIAFLHYSDLGAQYKSLKKFLELSRSVKNSKKTKEVQLSSIELEEDIDKFGKIDDILTKGDEVLVQVKKEPICTKGPRLASEVTLAGRYMILLPFSQDINISRKISSIEEKNRLKRLVSSIKPKNFGVVIRTVAEGKEAADLVEDIKNLLKMWDEASKKLLVAKPHDKLVGEINRVSTILRDILNDSFDRIIVDNPVIYDEVKEYISRIAPDKLNILSLHSGRERILEVQGVERQVKVLFGRNVSLESGGYLIIEKTEAMHVIDVNSGTKSMKEITHEEGVLRINLAAAKEVSRQLRLRDLGGIIVVDFIDMKSAEHRQLLQDTLQEYLKTDRSKTKMLPISKFGLVQITRQRVREEVHVNTEEICTACNGDGKTRSALTIVDDVISNVELLVRVQNERKITVCLHPYIGAYFTKGLFSIQLKWFFKYRTWVRIIVDSSYAVTESKYYNSVGEEINFGSC